MIYRCNNNDMPVAYRVVFSGDPPTGTLEFVSEACAALAGTTPDVIVERPAVWMEAIHEDDREAFVQTTAALIADGHAVTRHYRLRDAAGVYQMIEDRLTAMLDARGEVTGYEAVIAKPS
jgi:PAS domain-containing protein